jgi:transaldolase
MKGNSLHRLTALGQSVWLDVISRQLIQSGELRRLIEEDELRGVTSNPAIFQKAFAAGDEYDEQIRYLAEEGRTAEEIYETIAIEDVQHAADMLRDVYDRLGGSDGFVSLEVSPYLAHDTGGTTVEARRLWNLLDRPNVFIKIPATREGLPAIRQCISEGININVTLLFGLPRYREVTEAYIAGLEDRVAQGRPINLVRSVASFFLSRIDVLVDSLLEDVVREGGPQSETAARLRGEVATASAKVAYQIYRSVFEGERFRALRDRGAAVQRALWASTGTKNPLYSDIKYVEPLIGPDTVSTMPLETMKAYKDHGDPALRIEDNMPEAHRVLQLLYLTGVNIDTITQQLEDEGIDKFIRPLDDLLAALEEKRSRALEELIELRH